MGSLPSVASFEELTDNLGPFWTPWTGEPYDSNGDLHPPATMTVEFIADITQDNTRGIVIDKIEVAKCAALDVNNDCDLANTGRFVIDLRMPGQVWDADASASYNFRRWYRSEDGRYVSPDPIGLAGGEAGYFGYVGGNPMGAADPTGLDPPIHVSGPPTGSGTAPQVGVRLSLDSGTWPGVIRPLKASFPSRSRVVLVVSGEDGDSDEGSHRRHGWFLTEDGTWAYQEDAGYCPVSDPLPAEIRGCDDKDPHCTFCESPPLPGPNCNGKDAMELKQFCQGVFGFDRGGFPRRVLGQWTCFPSGVIQCTYCDNIVSN